MHVLAGRAVDVRAVTLHNLSAQLAKVCLPDDVDAPGRGRQMHQTPGDTDPPYCPGQEISLGRYGFRWLRQAG